MFNAINKILLGLFIILLTSCGFSNTLIKSAYNELDTDIANNFKEYVDLTEQQEQQVDVISRDMLKWHRTNELPKTRDLLDKAINTLEKNKPVSDTLLAQLIQTIQKPISFEGYKRGAEQLGELGKTLSDTQVQEIIEAIIREQRGLEKDMLDLPFDDTNIEITKYIQNMFRHFGIKLNKQQKQSIGSKLLSRIDNNPDVFQAIKQWDAEFIQLLEQRSKKGFTDEFAQHWLKLETLDQDANPQSWQHNQNMYVQIISDIVNELSATQKQTLIKKLIDIRSLVTELINHKSG